MQSINVSNIAEDVLLFALVLHTCVYLVYIDTSSRISACCVDKAFAHKIVNFPNDPKIMAYYVYMYVCASVCVCVYPIGREKYHIDYHGR